METEKLILIFYPVLTAVVTFFLLRIIKQLDQAVSDIHEIKTQIAVSKDTIEDSKIIIREWVHIKKDMDSVAKELETLKDNENQLVKKIYEIKAALSVKGISVHFED